MEPETVNLEPLNVELPMISIILPTYNRAKYITNILLDIKNQTFLDFELLIIDDGSTDNTREVIEKFFYNKNSYTYVQVEHTGIPGKLINYMVKNYSQGQFIAFAFDDDRWEPTCLTDLYTAIKDSEYDIVYGQARSTETSMEKKIYGQPFDWRELSLKNFIPNLGVIIKKDVFIESGGYSERWEDRRRCDWYYWIKLVEKYRFGYVPKIVGTWVAMPDGINR